MRPRDDLDPDVLLAAAAQTLRRVVANNELVTIAGDFHGEKGWAKFVLRAASRAGSTCVVQLGDFGIYRTDPAYLDAVEYWANRLGIPVVFVDGNHEDFDHLATYPIDSATGLRVVRPHVFHAPRGTRWRWGGLTWLALGGATSLNRSDLTEGFDWFPQEALTTGDVYRAAADGQVDVMLTHDCPAGVAIPGINGDNGWPAAALEDAKAHRKLLRSAVDELRPTHLFHGHFHTRYTAELLLGGDLVCTVTGLDMNGTMARAFVHLDTDILTAESHAAR